MSNPLRRKTAKIHELSCAWPNRGGASRGAPGARRRPRGGAPPRPFAYGETQASIKAVVEGIFAGQVIATSALAREAIHAKLHLTVGNPTAKAALDMALWDVIGQQLGVNVSTLLGGYGTSMRVSHMLGFADPQVMVDEASRMKDT